MFGRGNQSKYAHPLPRRQISQDVIRVFSFSPVVPAAARMTGWGASCICWLSRVAAPNGLWIPAAARMTGWGTSCICWHSCVAAPNGLWIPAAAGMTGWGTSCICWHSCVAAPKGLWIPAAARKTGDHEKTPRYPHPIPAGQTRPQKKETPWQRGSLHLPDFGPLG